MVLCHQKCLLCAFFVAPIIILSILTVYVGDHNQLALFTVNKEAVIIPVRLFWDFAIGFSSSKL